MTQLPDDWWTSEDVATYLGVLPSTVRSYVTRDQMPKPDRHMGRIRLWKPDTIKSWHQARPRQPVSKDAGLQAHQDSTDPRDT